MTIGRLVVVTLILLLVMLLVLLRTALLYSRVFGSAMAPTLRNGQYVVTEKVTHRFHSPVRGDLIAFRAPPTPSRVFMMRVIAVAGDRVTLRAVGGSIQVVVDGRVLREPYVAHPMQTASMTFTHCTSSTCSYAVPRSDVFVMGDNRAAGQSYDSRYWGPVPVSDVIGRVWLVF